MLGYLTDQLSLLSWILLGHLETPVGARSRWKHGPTPGSRNLAILPAVLFYDRHLCAINRQSHSQDDNGSVYHLLSEKVDSHYVHPRVQDSKDELQAMYLTLNPVSRRRQIDNSPNILWDLAVR